MQLQTEPRGRLAGAHQLHCSVLRMQRSEVKWEAREMLVSMLGGQSHRDFFLHLQLRLSSVVLISVTLTRLDLS